MRADRHLPPITPTAGVNLRNGNSELTPAKKKKKTFQVGFRERLLPGQVLLSSDLKEHI